MLVTAGMRLELSEAGLGESYGADLVFEPVAVPAPGAMAVLAGAGLLRRRRR
jgi:MYXO-CTERM domain-containing protein